MKEEKQNTENEKRSRRNKSGVITVESVSAVCILFSALALLILCTDTLVFGGLGGAISGFLLGALGFGAYPFFAFTGIAACYAFAGKTFIKRKVAFLFASLAVACLALLLHIAFTFGWDNETYLAQAYAAGADFSTATITGWVGALVAFSIFSMISKVGATIALALGFFLLGYLTYLTLKGKVKKKEKKTDQEAVVEQPQPAYPYISQQPYVGQGIEQAVEQAQSAYSPVQPAQANPFHSSGAYSSYAVPDVTQRPGVALPNDYKSQKPAHGDAYSEELARKEFLFGASARENFSRNLIFDKTANVNTRFNEMQSKLSTEPPITQTPSYTTQYENDLNTRVVNRPTYQTEERSAYTLDTAENTRETSFEELNQTDRTASIEENRTTRFDTEDFTRSDSRLGETFEPLEREDRTPLENDFVEPTRSVGFREDTPQEPSYRRHEYMDLFSTENPNVFGREDNTLEMPAERGVEETPIVREDRSSRDFTDNLRDSRLELFDDTEEDEFDQLPARDEGRRAFEPTPVVPTVQRPAPTPVVPEPPKPKKPRVRLPYKSAPSDYFDYRDVNLAANITEIEEAKEVIISTLIDYKISNPQIASTTFGPTVTRYNVAIPRTVSPSKVIRLDQEIAMQLFAKDGVSIYANYEDCVVSIEVPNKTRQFVQLGCMLTGDAYVNAKPTSLVFAMGKDVANKKVYGDITKMVYLLVAGTTGAGKSVLLNTMIISLINKYSPDELRMILIDPKQTEFVIYAGLPHLVINDIISDHKRAIQAMNWCIAEMHRRNKLFADKTRAGKRVVNIDEYNARLDEGEEKLPRILIIIDELADLMLAAKKEVEERIQSLTQMSRSAGIHVVVATQRPSVDVITGVIKSNLATRIACKVPTEVDSRVILDQTGAEKLLGMGDFVYKMPGITSPVRVQSAFISSDDIQKVVDYIKFNNQADFDEDAERFICNTASAPATNDLDSGNTFGTEADMSEFIEALRVFISTNRASASLLVTKLHIGFGKASRIVETMEEMNYISQYDGSKARKVLITKEQFIEKYGSWE